MSSERSIALAKRMGYTVRECSRPFNETTTFYWYELITPDGNNARNPIWLPSSEHANEFTTIADAWQGIPDYEHDVVAGIAALDATGCKWTLHTARFSDKYVCVIDKDTGTDTFANYFGESETPALAICAALEAYYERTQS